MWIFDYELSKWRLMQLRKVEHPSGKSFYWACNGPDCPYESEEIKYTMDNYHATPFCPRCGRGGNQGVDPVPASRSSRRNNSMMKLSDGEKLILIMLCEIHEKLKIENGVDTELVKEAIYGGNLWGMKWAFTGIFHDSEPAEEKVHEAVDILDMWSFLERDCEKLSPEEKSRVEKESHPFGKDVRFRGWDGSGEAEYISIARFLIEQLERFQEFKGRDLNSHMPSIDADRRMLEVFKPLRKSLGHGPLKVDDIIEILNARTHPENRKKKAAVPSGLN